MKTKPNFTYKQFIQKISNVQINNKVKPDNKSPKALKSQNKNVSYFPKNQTSKPFQKKSARKQQSLSRKMSPKPSPKKIQIKQNLMQQNVKNSLKITNIKSTTNKKLKLKNQPSISSQFNKQQNFKHSKSIREQSKGNLHHNQSGFTDQRHNESCSIYFKNYAYQNEEDNFQNSSISLGKSPSISSKLQSKKHSTSSIDSKLKIAQKGNLTDRDIQRVNTQYYEEVKKQSQRINTQYQKNDSNVDRQSPSFYKLSMDESSFLDYEDDKSHRNLFPQSRTKKSTISLYTQEQKTKINDKSYEHVYNKFISKISQILFQITRIDDQTQLLQHKIKYIQFLECLKELKMIKGDYQPYSQTQGIDLVKQLWEQLVMGHNINHFIIIVSLILKITPLQHIKSQDSPQLQNYIYIQKKYQQFRFTRLELDKSKVYSEKQSAEFYNFPFKPTISKTSQQIVSQPRSQRKYKINTSVNQNQSLPLNSKRQNTSINTEFQHQNQNLIRNTSPLGNKRSQILYKEAKKKSLQKRQNRSTIDIEYQKNKSQLTFKPKIIIKRKKPQHEQNFIQYSSPRFALDEQKAINRMIRGRVQKEVKQITVDKGIPYNQKIIEKLRRQKFEQIIKEQVESRMKSCQNQSKIKLKLSQLHNKSINQKSIQNIDSSCVMRCTTQVQQLQDIHNLSFQEYSNQQNENKTFKTFNQQIPQISACQQQSIKALQTSPLKQSNMSKKNTSIQNEEQQQVETSLSDEYFALDIYFEQNRSDKLLIRRDSSIEEVVAEAQRFVLKHNLPHQMGYKLKQELMIALKFHDIQKIQENAEEEQCSLLG